MDIDNPSYFAGLEARREAMDLRPGASAREKRTFFRSVSSNSADSNQEMFFSGEPRLCDIAPDLVGRSNSLKERKVVEGAVYMPLASSEEQADCLSEDEEVFIEEDSARYYNFPATKRRGQRRHSIGTFVARDRTQSAASSTAKSFKEDFPQRESDRVAEGADIDEHSLRHASYPRKRCTRCARGTTRNTNMDDILILSLKGSDAASLWVNYFSNYFQQISQQANRKPFKIRYIGIEEVLEKTEEEYKELHRQSEGVKLQLVVVCPSFLEFVSSHPEECSAVGKLILADRTLALLLGVADDDLTDVHKAVLPSYFHWQRQSVGQDQDENFTKEFLGQAMAILSKVWKQQSSVIAQEKSCFSVTPKKIRQGQNSVFVLLTYPLQKDDIVKISVEKNGELFEMRSVKRRNPYILKFTVPEALTEVTSIVNVLVEKNGSFIGSRPIKCESKLRELEQILRSTSNPVEFMCQTLGYSPAGREQLDNWLANGFQRNIPPHFHLLSNDETIYTFSGIRKHSHEEFPTLLHFASKFGLEKLAVQLLDCPGADVACGMRNIFDMTPVEIADANGFSELSAMFRGYINMNEFTSMYSTLKEMSLSPRSSDLDNNGYLIPKQIQDFYKHCPAPIPVEQDAFPTSYPVNEWSSSGGYMTMNNTTESAHKLDTDATSRTGTVHSPLNSKPSYLKLLSKSSQADRDAEREDQVQKELLEIINDFKNNVHSIAQAEKLVEEWKNRRDVQKSFQEKQQQLEELRKRYQQIQSETKTTTKKTSPYERFKKLFSREREDEHPTEISKKNSSSAPSLTVVQGQRPISSLSTSSSESSGRMSTISGCSFGDSGTHSDNEERKLMVGSHSEDDFRSKLNKAVLELNYNIVPTPKPFKVCSTRQTFETIQEKPASHPDAVQSNENFYIQFPPCGLPVPGMEDVKPRQQSCEYMNVLAGPSSTECPEYMNFKVPFSRYEKPS